MIHFWQRDRSSIENSSTFRTQTCAGCHRPNYPEMVNPARPICILPSYDEKEIVEHIAEGQPILDTLPEWDPVGCSQLFPTIDPVLHLKCDDNEANPIVHDVRGIYDQTLTFPTGDPNTDAHSVAGHIGTALHFSGNNDHVLLTAASSDYLFAANTNFTIAFWAKYITQSTPSAYPSFVANGNSTNPYFRWCIFGPFVYLQIRVLYGGLQKGSSLWWTDCINNTWYHWAFRRDGAVLHGFRNGIVRGVGAGIWWAQALIANNKHLCVGGNPVANFDAISDIDDFRLYNYALTNAQVAALAAM